MPFDRVGYTSHNIYHLAFTGDPLSCVTSEDALTYSWHHRVHCSKYKTHSHLFWNIAHFGIKARTLWEGYARSLAGISLCWSQPMKHCNYPLVFQCCYNLFGVVLYSVKWCRPREKCILRWEYSNYPHKTNTIVFTILSAIKWAKFHLSHTIIVKVSWFDYAIYF